ncbi:hypothetical protein J2Z19_001247 [Ensifer adhaerens]|uniref:Uncharacterized protein n=1 Tax=Ensifer adhaerens TaxID=106592 RepID=A0ACC5SRY5_ENSAD|nr:hypothetical protein [Ensifer adhaerens]
MRHPVRKFTHPNELSAATKGGVVLPAAGEKQCIATGNRPASGPV